MPSGPETKRVETANISEQVNETASSRSSDIVRSKNLLNSWKLPLAGALALASGAIPGFIQHRTNSGSGDEPERSTVTRSVDNGWFTKIAEATGPSTPTARGDNGNQPEVPPGRDPDRDPVGSGNGNGHGPENPPPGQGGTPPGQGGEIPGGGNGPDKTPGPPDVPPGQDKDKTPVPIHTPGPKDKTPTVTVTPTATPALLEHTICDDPANDENPGWVDFTKVTWSTDGQKVTFSEYLTGDPSGPNTELKTDTGHVIVFVNSQTRLAEYYAYAFGGPHTDDVGVQVRKFSQPKTGFDQDTNTIPNQGAKDDPIIYEAGSEAVVTNGTKLSYSIPKYIFDEIMQGREMWPWTTEGTGRGNEVKKDNGIQSFNKDHCGVAPEQPTPTPPATRTATPTQVPPTSTPTSVPPEVAQTPVPSGEGAPAAEVKPPVTEVLGPLPSELRPAPAPIPLLPRAGMASLEDNMLFKVKTSPEYPQVPRVASIEFAINGEVRTVPVVKSVRGEDKWGRDTFLLPAAYGMAGQLIYSDEQPLVIAAHVTDESGRQYDKDGKVVTPFSDIDQLEIGQAIKALMNGKVDEYAVKQVLIVTEDEAQEIVQKAEKSQLIMDTCNFKDAKGHDFPYRTLVIAEKAESDKAGKTAESQVSVDNSQELYSQVKAQVDAILQEIRAEKEAKMEPVVSEQASPANSKDSDNRNILLATLSGLALATSAAAVWIKRNRRKVNK